VPQSRFAPIKLSEGILFTTCLTLRSDERRDGALKPSRPTQISDRLGAEFDCVIVFDEAHALANAVGDKGELGEKAASQQGRAGLRLQNALPTPASSTSRRPARRPPAISPAPCAWGSGVPPTCPSDSAGFISAMEAGGIAAMQVLV
jgi:hypothetical protein